MDARTSAEATHFALACVRCRRRKQRCDRRAPMCGECARAGAECVRSAREAVVVRSVDGSVQDKSAITLLHERLHQLETATRRRGLPVDGSGGHLAPSPLATNHASNVSAPPTSGNSASGGANDERPAKRRRTAAMQSDTHRGLDLLSLGAMAEPTRRTGEMLRELSIPRLIFAVTEVFGGNPEQSQRIDRLWDCVARDIKRPTSETNRPKVPLAEGSDCVEKYFRLVDFRYPILFREDVQRGLSDLCGGTPEATGAEHTTSAHTFAALMVIAIVPLVVDDFSGAHGSFVSIHLLSRALQRLEDIFQMDDGIEIIQCLCLLVIYSLHSPAAGSSWHLIGFAMKKCIALGYHREPDVSALAIDESRQEKRRWVFWSCYSLDRLICTALGRPYNIDDAYVTAKLPFGSSPPTAAISRQVHIYSYARLMSTIIGDRAGLPLGHHLGRIIHWRSTAPEYFEPYPPDQEGHLKSIGDTLLLRAMIDQVVYAKGEGLRVGNRGHTRRLRAHGTSVDSTAATTSSPGPHESAIRDSDLYSTCNAVVASLTRASMRDRAFLSWLTGYSAFSAALGLLYCSAKERRKTCTTSPMSFNETRLDVETDLSPFSVQWAQEQSSLQGAVNVMAVVGRHFPRVAQYKAVVTQLYSLITTEAAPSHSQDRSDVMAVMDGASPEHLRRLVSVTLCLAGIDGQVG